LKRLIREEEIRKASENNHKIRIDNDTVITPSARDLAKELGVELFSDDLKFELSAQSAKVISKWPFHKVAIASDHGGFYLKEELKEIIRKKDFMLIDLGPANPQPCDYPDFAFKVALHVAEGKADCGIVIDSVGIGSAIAANKVEGILAAKCNNATEAQSAREHNYANILTMGSKIIGINIAKDIALAFLSTPGGEDRHKKRVAMILDFEKKRK